MTDEEFDLKPLNNDEGTQHHQSSDLSADAINEQLGDGIALNSRDEHIITALGGYPTPVPPSPTDPQSKSKS